MRPEAFLFRVIFWSCVAVFMLVWISLCSLCSTLTEAICETELWNQGKPSSAAVSNKKELEDSLARPQRACRLLAASASLTSSHIWGDGNADVNYIVCFMFSCCRFLCGSRLCLRLQAHQGYSWCWGAVTRLDQSPINKLGIWLT